MMSRRARVLAAYATVKLLDPATGKWTVHGFHRDAVFPPNADPENVAGLVRREYAEWVDEPAETVAEETKEPEPVEEPKPVKATKAAAKPAE